MPDMEVRCCCDGRLLGYLPERGREGDTVYFPVERFLPAPRMGSDGVMTTEMEMLALEIMPITVPSDIPGEYPDCHLSYKSRDYPLEKLRRIPQWVDLESGMGQ